MNMKKFSMAFFLWGCILHILAQPQVRCETQYFYQGQSEFPNKMIQIFHNRDGLVSERIEKIGHFKFILTFTYNDQGDTTLKKSFTVSEKGDTSVISILRYEYKVDEDEFKEEQYETFPDPHSPIKVFCYKVRYHKKNRSLKETENLIFNSKERSYSRTVNYFYDGMKLLKTVSNFRSKTIVKDSVRYYDSLKRDSLTYIYGNTSIENMEKKLLWIDSTIWEDQSKTVFELNPDRRILDAKRYTYDSKNRLISISRNESGEDIIWEERKYNHLDQLIELKEKQYGIIPYFRVTSFSYENGMLRSWSTYDLIKNYNDDFPPELYQKTDYFYDFY